MDVELCNSCSKYSLKSGVKGIVEPSFLIRRPVCDLVESLEQLCDASSRPRSTRATVMACADSFLQLEGVRHGAVPTTSFVSTLSRARLALAIGPWYPPCDRPVRIILTFGVLAVWKAKA